MRSFSTPVVAMVALLAPGAAFAADLPSAKGEPMAPSIASCDFFQNQLIGAFCENTFGGTISLEHEQRNMNYGTYSVPGYASSSSEQYNWFDATATAYIVPIPWLKLNVSSEHNNYSDIYNYYSNGFSGPYYYRNVYQLSNAAWQQASAIVRLVDYSAEDLRVFGGVNATIGFLPAVAGNLESTQFSGSLFGGAHWALGYSNLSLNPYGTIGIGHYSASDQTSFSTSFRVLLAQDIWGVAAGPIVNASSILHLRGGLPQPAQSYSAGAHFLWEPFRQSQTPILRDVNLNCEILHSLGQLSLGRGNFYGTSADEMIYSGSVQFNFTY